MPVTAAEVYLEELSRHMRGLLEGDEPASSELRGMMRYHLGWVGPDFQVIEAQEGKRVRALLCLWSAEAAGGDWRRALPAAAAIEILHNFSLVHDDVQDRSETRRHRPTVWALWGDAQAINVGDALFALAYLALQDLATEGAPCARLP